MIMPAIWARLGSLAAPALIAHALMLMLAFWTHTTKIFKF